MRFSAVFAAVTIAVAVGAAAQSERDQELSALFQDVIANPGDATANILYARRAEELGQTRKALAAYERIVAADPSNVQAQRELTRLRLLTKPPRTRWIASLGGQYNSNKLLRSDQDGRDSDDVNGVAVVRMQDERNVGERRVSTDAFVYGTLHNRFGESDLAYASAASGPLWILDNGWSLATRGSVEAAMLSDDFLFVSGGIQFNVDPEDSDRAWQGADVSVSWAEFGPEFKDRDGLVVNATTAYRYRDIASTGAILTIQPQYTFNGASGDNNRNRFHEFGVDASALRPVATDVLGFQQVFGLVEFGVSGRVYEGHRPEEGEDRRDLRLTPGVRVIGSQFMGENITATANYSYERNLSSDSTRISTNHQTGLTISIGF